MKLVIILQLIFIDSILCTEHCAKHLIYIISFYLQQPSSPFAHGKTGTESLRKLTDTEQAVASTPRPRRVRPSPGHSSKHAPSTRSGGVLSPQISQQIATIMLLLLLSHFGRVRLWATPQTAAHQAPPSLGFSRNTGVGWQLPRLAVR